MKKLMVTMLVALSAFASGIASDFHSTAKVVTPPTEGWIEVFNEDFSGFSNGTADIPDETQLADAEWRLPTGVMASDEWTGFGLYQAGEAIAINCPSYGGFLNSPEIPMKGLVRVSFRLKSLDPIGTGKVLVCRGGIVNPRQVDNDAPLRQFDTDGWQDYEFYFQNIYDDPAFVQINTLYMSPEKKGIVIDDLRIAYNPTYVPMITSATTLSYDNDGFSIGWGMKTELENEDFMVSLYKEVANGDDVVVNQDFTTWETNNEGLLPSSLEEWKITRMFSNHPGVFDFEGNRTLAFGHHDEIVELPSNGGKFTELSFDYINYLGDDARAWGAQITVQGWDGNNWKGINSVGGYGMDDMGKGHADFGAWEDAGPVDGEVHVPAFRGLYSKIRFICESANYGAMLLIDNVHYETLPAAELECVEKDRLVNDLSTEFNGLDMNENYVVGVKVRNIDSCSEEAFYSPFGVATPILAEPTEIVDSGYTANWKPVAKATSYILTVSDCITLSEAIDDYEHASADFSDIEVGTDDYFEPVVIGDMQSLTDLGKYIGEGWVGAGVAAINGGLGCKGTFYPGSFGILSPELNLSADDGKFTFKANAWVCDCSGLSIGTNAGQTDSEMFINGGNQEIVLEIEGGEAHDKVAIFSTDGAPFYLHDFTITQDFEVGEIVVFDSKTYNLPADKTCFYVDSPVVEGLGRAYEVAAYRKNFTREARSSFSDKKIVIADIGGIESGKTMKTSYSIQGLDLILNLEEEATVCVWNVDGTPVYYGTCRGGSISVSLPASGLYILRVGSMNAKIFAI